MAKKKTKVNITINLTITEDKEGWLNSDCTVELDGNVKDFHAKRVHRLAMGHIDQEVTKAVYKLSEIKQGRKTIQ